MTDNNAQPTADDSKTLVLPLTRREAILALFAAVSAKRRKDIQDSHWTTVVLSDGALD